MAGVSPQRGRRSRSDEAALPRAVVALGIVQIIAWGTTVYALAVLGAPISADTGWGRSTVFTGMTLGLLSAGAVSTRVGQAIDRHGARPVMATGSVLAGLALAGLSQASSQSVYLGLWIVAGVAMRMVLYEAAFAALVQLAPERGRRAIGLLTLFGGFASTVFWPLGHWLAAWLGWRHALLVYAGLHLCVCLPLVLYGLGRRTPEQPPSAPAHARPVAMQAAVPAGQGTGTALEGAQRRQAMGLFTIVMSANSFVFGALSAHLVTIIEHVGIAAGAAVALASLKGVAQVAGRLWEILFAGNLSAIAVGRIAIALLPAAFVALLLAGGRLELALLFTLLLGVSNGLVTIVKGAVPLMLFGAAGYGALIGLLATPQLVATAVAPAVFAAVVDHAGEQAGIMLLVAASLLSLLAMEALSWWHVRQLRRAGKATT